MAHRTRPDRTTSEAGIVDRTVSRRTLARGAAWSLPVMAAAAAVPALAVSQQYAYYMEGSQSSGYQVNTSGSSCRTVFTLTSRRSVNGASIGFAIGYEEGYGVGTTATVSGVKAVYLIPKGLVTSFTVTSGSSTWTYAGKTNPSTVTLENGTVVSATNYDVFTFTFTGTTTNEVMVDSDTSYWPGSTYTATSTSPLTTICPGSSLRGYAGYTMDSYTTASDGVSTPVNLIQSVTYTPA